jgi:hypothetical protein
VPILKPAQRHKYNTKTVQVHKKTLNKQNKNSITKKRNIKEVMGHKPYTLKKYG